MIIEYHPNYRRPKINVHSIKCMIMLLKWTELVTLSSLRLHQVWKKIKDKVKGSGRQWGQDRISQKYRPNKLSMTIQSAAEDQIVKHNISKVIKQIRTIKVQSRAAHSYKERKAVSKLEQVQPLVIRASIIQITHSVMGQITIA